MKVLGIVGSPKNGGNTAILLENVLKGAMEKGAEIKKINFSELNMTGCQGCQGCKIGEECVVKDDMHILYDEIKSADSIVLGTAIYNGQMTSQMKMIFDRFYAFYRADMSIKIPSDKTFSAVVSQGDPRLDLHKTYLDNTMALFDGRFIKGDILISSGDVKSQDDVIKKAIEFGLNL